MSSSLPLPPPPAATTTTAAAPPPPPQQQQQPFHVLLVLGSWHTHAHAQPLIASLATRGISCTNALYPSNACTAARLPPDLDDPYTSSPSEARELHPDFLEQRTWPDGHADARFVQAVLEELVDGKEGSGPADVLVVAHSWGAMPATEACREELGVAARRGSGKKGGVLGIFYAASLPVPVGTSTLEFLGGKPLPAMVEHLSGLVTMKNAGPLLFGELPQEEQKRWVEHLAPQPLACHKTTLEYGGYLHVPCGYLVCENDLLLPVSKQEELIEGMEKMGVDVRVWRSPSGHEPMITWTDGLRDVLIEFSEHALQKIQ